MGGTQKKTLRIFLILIALDASAQQAMAGMPTAISLTDVARLRVQTISFFLLILLMSAAIIRWIWNSLSQSFPKLPRLSFAKAFGLIVLWSLLFNIVLLMISGARELMTPGAWERDGATYKLRDGGAK